MAQITELSQLDMDGTYSYADYLTWQFEETVELIRGKIMLMAPAPNLKHQRISRDLLRPISNYFHKHPCQVFHAPFDVSLYDSRKSKLADREIFSVVQPDLCVICDPDKLTVQGCSGAPDWVIEILSPNNSKRDARIKFDLYEENGVSEYWLVYPYEQSVYQFVLNDDSQKYQLHGMYAQDGLAVPYLFPDLPIDLADVFAE
ncbi:MAG: Uma2 family endonuclease [Methylovulum sp.]|uniref:Uma2 family endonuclease n=1 Tax=Methylovulum sp. TaxID=1916980 RepID=UPI0026121D85|nr:Uma2 family endonuclease [Methylovulum sp.]MDD2724659.1 Uma2 family endonuclease [Methylovulum sp.]MDD5123486.1 Uma2 family endonuclease [Methylovulum sp.]